MATTTITFLGTAAVLPGAGEDSACYLINGRVLIDTGWYAALKMQQYGYSALDVEHLIFTHFHHDHYMGVPALLFFRGMRQDWGDTRPPLRILGPAEDVATVVERAQALLQTERFPNIAPPLEVTAHEPGQPFETDTFRLDTIPALHGVQAMSLRLTDKRSGVVIGFSGDTGVNPALPELVHGCDLLIHEASLAPEVEDAKATSHTRATDAARVAVEAGARRLRLVHLAPAHAKRSLEAARAIYPGATLASEGETLVLTAGR